MDFISLGVAIVSTFLGARDQNRQDKQNKKAARGAMSQVNRDVTVRALQERISAALEERAYVLDAAEAASSVSSAAAAGNVGGMTVDLLLQDIDAQKATGLDAIRRQRDANLAALETEREAGFTNARNMANQTAPVNPFAVGLRILGDVADWKTERTRRRPKTGPKTPSRIVPPNATVPAP